MTMQLSSGLTETLPCLTESRAPAPARHGACKISDGSGNPASMEVTFRTFGCSRFEISKTATASSRAFYADPNTGTWPITGVVIKGRMHQHDVTGNTDLWSDITGSALTISNTQFGNIALPLKGSLMRAKGNCVSTKIPTTFSMEAIAE